MRALGASRARVLHVPRPSRRVAPLTLPALQSHATRSLLTTTRQRALATSPAGQELAATAARQPLLMSAPPEPLPLATSPLEQRELIHKRVH